MPFYEDLQAETYYLIREEPGTEIKMVSVLMRTEMAVLLRGYLSDAEDFFKDKSDHFEEIVEELDGDMVAVFESIYAQEISEED
jgi:hypothetical protein